MFIYYREMMNKRTNNIAIEYDMFTVQVHHWCWKQLGARTFQFYGWWVILGWIRLGKGWWVPRRVKAPPPTGAKNRKKATVKIWRNRETSDSSFDPVYQYLEFIIWLSWLVRLSTTFSSPRRSDLQSLNVFRFYKL